MHIVLIRHFESEKNINNTFSSTADDDVLTAKGKIEAKRVAQTLCAIREKHDLDFKNIYCASSARSIESADIIKKSIGVTTNKRIEVIPLGDLCSTRAGILSGKSELEAKEIAPQFSYQLMLHRAGLFDSYKFIKISERESRKHAEVRVLKTFDRIVSDTSESLKIVIGHRSSIAAILIDFARKYYSYPKSYFGYIQLDLGHVSWFRKTKKKLLCFGVNLSQNQLNDLLSINDSKDS